MYYFKDSFIYYVYSVILACKPACYKRALDLIIDSFEPPWDCWILNSGPREEMFLTYESSLQLLPAKFYSISSPSYRSPQAPLNIWLRVSALVSISSWEKPLWWQSCQAPVGKYRRISVIVWEWALSHGMGLKLSQSMVDLSLKFCSIFLLLHIL